MGTLKGSPNPPRRLRWGKPSCVEATLSRSGSTTSQRRLRWGKASSVGGQSAEEGPQADQREESAPHGRPSGRSASRRRSTPFADIADMIEPMSASPARVIGAACVPLMLLASLAGAGIAVAAPPGAEHQAREAVLLRHKPTMLLLDEFQTWYDGLKDSRQAPAKRGHTTSFNSCRKLRKNIPSFWCLHLGSHGSSDAYQQVHRVNPIADRLHSGW